MVHRIDHICSKSNLRLSSRQNVRLSVLSGGGTQGLLILGPTTNAFTKSSVNIQNIGRWSKGPRISKSKMSNISLKMIRLANTQINKT